MGEDINKKALSDLQNLLIQQLRELNYSDSTIAGYELYFHKLKQFMDKIKSDDYYQDIGDAFLQNICHQSRSYRNITAFISRLNDCLIEREYHVYHSRKIILITPEHYVHIEKHYVEWCKKKGNSLTTVRDKKAAFTKFIHLLENFGCNSIDELKPCHITKIILLDNHHERMYGYFREILKFMAVNNYVAYDYSTLIPKRHIKYCLPSTYSKNERIRLERAPCRNTALGKRDYAIILLANRLGLRSCDIADLSFSKVDFNKNTINFTQIKTNNDHVLYLVDDVKNAIIDYINNGRPVFNDDHIFLMHKAPYYPITAIAIHGIVSKYFRKAHVDTSGKKHGVTSLRASLSTDMINSGESYDQTRKILGHRSQSTIKHYAKLDIERLRLCSLEVREASGFFERFLNGEVFL